jgi:hypothetical protein
MPRKTSIRLLFSIPLIVILCVIGYLLFSTKSPTQEEVLQPQTQATSTEYRNTDYGFSVTLPLSWKGYLVVNDVWKAYSLNASQSSTSDETGPLLSVRNPLWSTSTPRQDIPIMVFSLSQWDLLIQDKIHIGAAPINPSELGRNAKYVFALPARYNFAYPVGYEEVDAILQTKPLHGF